MTVSTEQKVGLFFLLALVAFAVMIELVEDWNPFEEKIPYHTFFESAVGIRVGDPVRMAGVDVGKIDDIALEEGRVRVSFHVEEETQVKTDSVASIRQTNLLGGQFLGLDFGSSGSDLLPPGSVLASVEQTSVDQLVANLDRNQERILGELGALIAETREPLVHSVNRVEEIMRRIDEGQGFLGKLINEPGMYENMEIAVAELKSLLQNLERGEGTLGRLLQDPSLYDDAKSTVASLRHLANRVENGEGTLGRLLVDETLYLNTSHAMAEWGEVAGKIRRGEGTLGKLVQDDVLYEETRDAMARIRSIAAKIDDGEGTIGRLINEDDLYSTAKTTLHKVEKTVDGMSDSGPLSALGVVLGTMF